MRERFEGQFVGFVQCLRAGKHDYVEGSVECTQCGARPTDPKVIDILAEIDRDRGPVLN